jgi:hypothetical protein
MNSYETRFDSLWTVACVYKPKHVADCHKPIIHSEMWMRFWQFLRRKTITKCNEGHCNNTTNRVRMSYSLTHGAEPFWMNHQFCSYSRTSQHFMEPEGSLPCSQEPSTGPYPKPYRSSPYRPILSLKSILILSTHLSLCLPSSLFLSDFPTNILYAFLFSPVRAICPVHPPWLDHSNYTWRYKLWSIWLCILPQLLPSCLSDPNRLHSTTYSDTLNLCFS